MSGKTKAVTAIPLQMVGELCKIRHFALVYVLLSVFFTAFAYGSSAAKDVLAPEERLWLTNNQSRIVLAVETGYAPFVFLDSKDQPTGLAHDYILLLESKLGVHFKQKRFSSLDEIFKDVRSGEAHIINAVTKTPSRSAFINFTDSFVSVPNVIVVRKERSDQMQEKNLSGLRVSLVKSYAVTENLINKNLGFAPDLVPDDLTALLNASFGRSDAAVTDLATASYLITQKGITNLRVAGEVPFDIRLSMGAAIDEPVLLSILQKGLAAITDAERLKIRNRWINVSSHSLFADRQFWITVGSVLFIALIIISGILIWNRTLRKEIAERKEAERKLAESEDSLRRAQAVAHIGSWHLDLASNSLVWSEETYRIFAVKDGGPLNYADFLACVHPDDRSAVDAAWQAALKGAPYDISHRIVTGGQTKWVREQAEFAFDSAGQLTAGVGTVQDITAEMLVNLELKRSNAELEQFSYAISHDMRQPLRMISSYLQLLEKRLAGQLDGDCREFFDFAIDGAQRLDKMLVALLDYSRVGRKGEPPEWIESRGILDEALWFLKPAVAEAQAEVKITGDWPRIFVSRDEIMRLLQNLIGNAVKYRIAGRTPEITVSSETVGKEWHLSVADNGVGILPDQIHRLFQVFQRLQTQAAYEGTGIGLALCRRIVEHHGGHIEAESPGEHQGSTFHVRLPLQRE